MEHERPKVGLGAYILNERNELLLLRRKGAHGSGAWCPPGGHLEFGETFEECARRESKEETDLDVRELSIIGVTNDAFPEEGKHYVTIAMRARDFEGEPKITEPEKSDDMGWFPLNNLPSPLFVPVKNFFESNPPCLCASGVQFKECCGKK